MHRKNGMSTFYAQILFCCILLIVSCSNDEKSERKRNISDLEKLFYNGIGVGPIKVLKLENSINPVLSSQGEKIFQSKCVTCHLLTEDRKIGPGLEGISLRRRPEWIMNQILNPLEMAIKDSLSKELLSIYLSQMTNMDLTQSEARSVLEFFRDQDKKSTKY